MQLVMNQFPVAFFFSSHASCCQEANVSEAWGRRTSPSRKTQASMSRLHVSSGGPRKVSDQRSVSCSWRGRGVSIGSGPASGRGGVRVWTWVKGQQSSRVQTPLGAKQLEPGQDSAVLRCAALRCRSVGPRVTTVKLCRTRPTRQPDGAPSIPGPVEQS